MAKALAAYHQAREQAVRYVLGALDPTAFNAPALLYGEVLTRVQALIATEMERDAAPAEALLASPDPQAEAQEEETHG